MRRTVPPPHCTPTAGSSLANARLIPSPMADASLDRWDLLQLGILFLLWFCLLVLRNDSLPLQIWDESRLANSALEMVRNGHWLVPSYGGVPDHWSVKPPLLIWQMAALLQLGLPPLLAVRLPTMLAGLATVGCVWAVCRYTLRDRAAAVLAGLLLLSASVFTNIHIARTGDYDVPLGLFTLLYVLTFWRSIEQRGKVHTGWFAIFAAALVLAVMTKGVAGTFGLVGLFIFTLVKRQLLTLLRNLYVWSFALFALFLCLGYYASRELYDPGYLAAVWQNELASRYFATNEGHSEGPLFYINLLIIWFEPGLILLPLVALTVLRADSRRQSLATLCLVCAVSMLIVLTTSRTKIFWYATPVFPFLAIAAALGVTDGLRWIRAREPHLPKLFKARPLQIAIGILLAIASAASLYRNQVMKQRTAEQAINAQLWYGALFDKLQARGILSVIVLDGDDYNPVLKFYAGIASTNGLRVTLPALAYDGSKQLPSFRGKGAPVDFSALLPAGKLVATCDPKLVPWLKYRDGFSLSGEVHSCVFGVIAS